MKHEEDAKGSLQKQNHYFGEKCHEQDLHPL